MKSLEIPVRPLGDAPEGQSVLVVADATALAAVVTTFLSDGTIVTLGDGSQYKFNATATTGGVTPTTGDGRWYLITNAGETNVKTFGAVGDGVTNDTTAVQNAINSGLSLYFPEGVYLVDALSIPVAAKGAVYRGSGFYYYNGTSKTVLKARTNGQASVIAMVNGADNITFKDMQIHGNDNAAICIDGTYGSFLTLDGVGVSHSTAYGYKGRQGVNRFNRVMSYSHAAIGFEIYSDTAVSNSEFSGGTKPLRIIAGGNRFANIWVNSGSSCCIELSPLDNATTLINTSFVNIYIGEVVSAVEAPIFNVVGTAAQYVQQTQIVGGHSVSAAGAVNKINGHFQLTYAKDFAISGLTALGNETGTADVHTTYFLKADNSENINITGCVIKQFQINPIQIGASVSDVNITGTTFSEFGTSLAAGAQGAAIRITDGTAGRINVVNCGFISLGVSAVPYIADVQAANQIRVDNCSQYYNSGVIIVAAAGTPAYSINGTLSAKTLNSDCLNQGKNYIARGDAATLAGGSTTTLYTFPNNAANKSYLVSVRQKDSAANNAMAMVFVINGNVSATRIAQDNTNPALDLAFSVAGLDLKITSGTGYGATTWEYVITPLG